MLTRTLGQLRVDNNAPIWDDIGAHDPSTGRHRDDEASRDKWPEGFKWTCCWYDGDSDEICNEGPHEPESDSEEDEGDDVYGEGPAGSKRPRLESLGEDVLQ